jgi:hypothetical protein
MKILSTLGLLPVITVVFVQPVTQAAESPQRRELVAQRLKAIAKIRQEDSGSDKWEQLIEYVRSGPTFQIRTESATLLSRVRKVEAKNALVKIACDAKAKQNARLACIAGLRGHPSQLTSDDIEQMLCSDPKMHSVMDGTLTELACRTSLSFEQVTRILETHGKSKNPNIRVLVIIFSDKHLSHLRRNKIGGKIKKTLEDFLYTSARKATDTPPNLRPFISRAFANHDLPGAVEVAIACVKDGIERQATTKAKYRPKLDIQRLVKLTGKSFGFDAKKTKAGSRASLEAAKRWVDWWEKNKDTNPKYRLPKQ